MTDKNLTHILVVRDRSGSMEWSKRATNEGFDEFINAQKALPGQCFVTLVDFDDYYEEVYTTKNIKEVDKSNLQPRGMTALYDAIGKAVVAKGKELAALNEKERPGSVNVLVLTDGGENASREWTATAVKDLVTEQREKYGWDFTFIGANQNAVLTGTGLGFSADKSLTYDTDNAKQVFSTYSGSTVNYRSAIASGASQQVASVSSFFTDEDRKAAVAK